MSLENGFFKDKPHIKTNLFNLEKHIDTIKEFNWKVKDLYIKDNCIYAKVVKPNGKLEDEGLYAASEDDPKDVCFCNYERDEEEANIFDKIRADQVCLGICRGLEL